MESPAFKGLALHVLTVVKKPDDEGTTTYLNEAEQKVRAAGFNPVCQVLQGDLEKVIASYVEDLSTGQKLAKVE